MSERIKVAQTNQITAGQARLVQAKGREIALFNADGKFYAIDNTCTHSRGPLAEGHLFGTTVTCPWHGSQFDIKSGRILEGPAVADVATFSVHIEGESIFVEI